MLKDIKNAIKYLMVKASINPTQIQDMPTWVDYCYDIARMYDRHKIKTIIDVGANIGQVATKFYHSFPNAQIYAFEPVDATYAAGVANTSKLGRIEYLDYALGIEPQTITIPLHENSQLNSLQPSINKYIESSARDFANIRIERLEQFAQTRAIDWIDILKTDTEGLDLQVIEGAGELVTKQRIGFIVSETGFTRSDKRHTYFSNLLDYLDQNGYWFYGFYEKASLVHFKGWGPTYCNALFVNRNLLA